MKVTALTLVRDREAHLRNLLLGLDRGDDHPDAAVVVRMGGRDPRPAIPPTSFPVEVVDLPDGDAGLPLARARNVAAHTARTDGLVFLDVDCIPGGALVGRYRAALEQLDALLMGPVRYLEPGAADHAWDEDVLQARSRPHPARVVPVVGDGRSLVMTDEHALFWSLSFAVRRATFLDVVGGFDEELTGYGGEDTDLALRAREAHVPLAWVPHAVAYHQHHETYAPPLQHVRSIVPNARRFRARWGSWPMEGWLERFAELGLVAWEPDGERLELLREPTPRELADARRDQVVPDTSA